MKKRFLTILSLVMVLIMASSATALAADTGFTTPKNGDTVLLGSTVKANFVMGYRAGNGQPTIKISVQKPNGETEAFESYDYYEFASEFKADKEGTYKIIGECGSYINIFFGSSGWKLPMYDDGSQQVLTIKVVKQLPNPLKIKAKTATIKGIRYGKLQKKKTLPISKVVKFTKKGQGKMTYTKVSGNKKISINKKTGKITLKKGLKKGTYKVKIKVKAAGNKSYKAATKKVTVKIKVK